MISFRKAITSEVKPLVGLYAESGGGKTKSALLLAKGFCGDMAKVGMIETESGRGEAWADDPDVGGYNVLPIREEFSPKTYGAAIGAAEKAGFQCLIVDSASHEWEGVGGVLAMAAENQASGKKGPLVWQKPKMDHQREFMLRLTQTPIPLVIVCMRAKYPMEEKVVPARGDYVEQQTGQRPPNSIVKKDWVRSTELAAKQSEDILFEMFVHGWLDKEKHAFHGTKYTIDALRQIFIDGQPITIQTGERLQAWASGRTKAPPPKSDAAPSGAIDQATGAADYISPDAAIAIDDKLREAGIAKKDFLDFAEVNSLALLPAKTPRGADMFKAALKWIEQNRVTA